MTNSKSEIGLELRKFLDIDPQYCRMLIPYAYQKGAITREEAEIAFKDLNEYYEKTQKTDTTKMQKLSALLPVLGFSKLKVLYNLIEQLPSRVYKDFEMFPDDKKIMGTFAKIKPIEYYGIITSLVKLGYIAKGKQEGKKTYIINFAKIDEIISLQQEKTVGTA